MSHFRNSLTTGSAGNLSQRTFRPFGFLAVGLVWLIAFCCWFNSFGMPNNPGVQRWMLWTMIPFDLCDLIDPPVIAGADPWSWLALLQRIPFLGVAVMIWLGAWGYGSVILRWLKVELSPPERLFFSLCIGLSLISLVTLMLGLFAGLHRGLFVALLIFGPFIEFWLRGNGIRGLACSCRPSALWAVFSARRQIGVALMIMTPFVAVQLLGAMSPQTDFDVLEYHLGGPKEWFQQGHISRLPHNVYTNFPFLSEMLILAGMVVYGDWQWGALAGQACIAGFAPLTALGLYAAGRRWFSERAGCLAALISMTSPWTYRISIIAYAEGSLACYLFASLFAAILYRDLSRGEPSGAGLPQKALAFLTGLMAGSAMACKYTGLISVVIPMALLMLWITLSLPQPPQIRIVILLASLFTAGVMTSVGPWLVKNVAATGNPVYPLAVRLFGGVDRDEELDAKWRKGHAPPVYHSWNEKLRDLPVKLADVTANNDWHSPLMFGFAPLSLFWIFRQRKPTGSIASGENQSLILVVTWLYVAWQFLAWWQLTHHIDRFYVPMFSAVALLAGVGADWPCTLAAGSVADRARAIWRGCSAVILVMGLCWNAEVMLRLGGFNAGRLDLIAARNLATPNRIRWLNDAVESGRLPHETKVLCVGEAQMFHARYPYLYNTVFDHSRFVQLCAQGEAGDQQLRPVEEIRADFRRLGVTHLDVNWAEIGRYRAPGSYGYTNFVQPERFDRLQQLGLLGPSLLTTTEPGTGVITGQIFPVLD